MIWAQFGTANVANRFLHKNEIRITDSSIGVDAAAPANDGLSMTTSSSKTSCSNLEEESNTSPPNKNQAPIFVSWRKAFRRKELYLLWVTRLSVVLITQVCDFSKQDTLRFFCKKLFYKKLGSNSGKFKKPLRNL